MRLLTLSKTAAVLSLFCAIICFIAWVVTPDASLLILSAISLLMAGLNFWVSKQ